MVNLTIYFALAKSKLTEFVIKSCVYPPYGTPTSYYGVSAIDFATSGNNKYSQDGRRTNDVVAFRHNRRSVVSLYGVCPWSKTPGCRKPQYFVSGAGIGIHDFIWSWIARANKQEFILNTHLNILMYIPIHKYAKLRRIIGI
jgi:hypothetical protein